MSRRIVAVLGVALAIVGLVGIAAPGVVSGLPINRGFVLMLGFVLVLGGLRELQRRRSREREYAETPDTEEAIELPTPGDDFDRRFDMLGMTRYRVGERERLRNELSEMALATLVRRKGLSEAEAKRALESGTWTDDPYAAALFTGRPPDVGRVGQLREFFQTGPAFKSRADRAAGELARLVESDLADTAGDDDV